VTPATEPRCDVSAVSAPPATEPVSGQPGSGGRRSPEGADRERSSHGVALTTDRSDRQSTRGRGRPAGARTKRPHMGETGAASLADIVRATGFRRAAAELNMSPGWLSRRQSMRRDRTIFRALEEGSITSVQANELLSAHGSARRTLLDRRARRPVVQKEVRTWSSARAH
jgi:hypothetical protein